MRTKQPIPAAYNRYDQERFKGKEGELLDLSLPLAVVVLNREAARLHVGAGVGTRLQAKSVTTCFSELRLLENSHAHSFLFSPCL